MNKRNYGLLACLAAVLGGNCFCPTAKAILVPLMTDNAGNYNISAQPFDVTLNNPALGAGNAQTVHAWIYKDTSPNAVAIAAGNGIPVPVLRLTVGQMVTVNFQNNLPIGQSPEGVSIHWHGIELDNDSDGTAVTQDTVKTGQSYTYRFVVSRPGLFWFHSHMVPGDTLFAGMYGILIVTDPCETALMNNNVVPADASTFPIAMTDIEWDTDKNSATFGEVGRVDKNNVDGGGFKPINKWIHDCGNGVAGGGTGPNNVCGAAAFPGETVLVNGCNPDTMGSLVTKPVISGQTIRLQLFNEALTRNFDVFLWNPTNSMQYPLIRIGGQGGLLDYARLEGDIPVAGANNVNSFGWKTHYDAGHISLSSGVRADAAVCIPASVTNGTLILMAKNNTAEWPLQNGANPATGFTIPATYPLAFFTVMPGTPPPCPCIVSNTAIRAALGPSGGCCPIINLTNAMTVNSFIPTNLTPTYPSSANTTFTLATSGAGPNIDGLNLNFTVYPNGQPLDGNLGNGAAWQPPNPPTLPTDRYAYVGSLLVLSVRNQTGAAATPLAHPYHLHGFSMQPIAMVDNTGPHYFGYNEFLDTIDVYGAGAAAPQTYIFSVLLEDRPKYCDLSSGTGPNNGPVLQPCTDGGCGGALGRWLYHCHIAEHGVIGMMGDIIVLAQGNRPMGMGQPPDTITPGSDVLATAGTGSETVADDFLWQNAGPITHVTIWGSWLNDMVDPSATFELKFWTDVPACNTTPSYPGWQAWEQMFPPGSYSVSNYYQFPPYPYNETFVDPSFSNCVPPGDSIIWQYDFDMPNLGTDFYPLPGSPINWLSVTAYTATNSGFRFGWKTTPLQYGWGDDSSWSPTLWGPPWTELVYPPCVPFPNAGKSMNQAFQLYTPGSTNCMAQPDCMATGGLRGAVVLAQPPTLTTTLSNAQVRITWAGGGTLQFSDSPTGPWSTVPDSLGSPYLTSASVPQRFYRVVVGP